MSSRRAPVAHILATRIERAALLDRLADPLSGAVRGALAAGAVKDPLSGTWLGHTPHPMLTDVTVLGAGQPADTHAASEDAPL